MRWTTRDQWHLTLQFLGRVGDVDALLDAVRAVASAVAPFEAQLGHGGAFPRPARAAILWVGLVRGADEVTALAAAVARETAKLGYEADEAFHPHLTLARAKQRRDLRPAVDAIGHEPVGPSWQVTDLVLFESDTRPDGARYTAISRVPLQV